MAYIKKFLIVLEAEKSEIKVPAWSMSDEGSLSGLQMALILLCPHLAGKESPSFVFLPIRALIPFLRAPPS